MVFSSYNEGEACIFYTAPSHELLCQTSHFASGTPEYTRCCFFPTLLVQPSSFQANLACS